MASLVRTAMTKPAVAPEIEVVFLSGMADDSGATPLAVALAGAAQPVRTTTICPFASQAFEGIIVLPR